MIYSKPNSCDSDIEESILKVYDLFLNNFQFFVEGKGLNTADVFINKAILYTATVSIFDDIRRCKEYSELDIADRHKIAGYTIKWLSKLKPIQTSIIDDFHILTINNFFSLYCGLTFLSIKEDDYDNISPDYFDHLLYETQYRTISGRCYASKLYLLEKSITSGIQV